MTTEKLKEIILGITDRSGLVDFYLEETSKLEKKDTKFFIIDLDDTLFCRDEQLSSEKGLRENRGMAGNTFMINQIGLSKMIETYYRGKDFPQEIISKLDSEAGIMLTAGVPEYQYMKQKALGLEKYSMVVVRAGQSKILETIRHIIFELQYIPSEIIIYEDRPEYFIEYRELIQGVLGCKLTIMKVEMNGNEGYKKIEEV